MNLGLGIGPTFIGPAFLWSPSRLRVGTRDVRDFTVHPNRLYSDTACTTLIAGPGAEVAAMCDSQGVRVLEQATAAARPKYAVQPAVGVRNFANGSAAVASDASWFDTATSNDVTVTKLSSGVTPDGNAWARYNVAGTATGTAFPQLYDAAQSRTPASAGQSWTASALMRVESGTTGGAGSGLRVNADEETAPATSVGSTVSSVFSGASLTTISATRAMTTGNQVRTGLIYRVAPGETVDCIVYVEALQFELGTSRTAWQANMSQFDVTEAGVRSLDVLVPDGIDDCLTLSSAFLPSGNFTLAAAFDHRAGADNLGILGGTNARFGQSLFNQPRIDANLSANRTQFTEQSNGRGVLVVRSVGSGAAQGWRNGVALTPTLIGSMRPLASPGFTEIMKAAGVFASGRFFGGVMIDEGDTPFTDAERLMTERYLAYNGGITL